MRKLFIAAVSFSIIFGSSGCHSARESQVVKTEMPPVEIIHQVPDRPKLVIGIVVDQMRYDFLYRYWDKYSEEGFKKLIREGFSCENTKINYIPTYTACGHSCIYTGSTPSLSGIAGNEWYDRQSGKEIYCVEDTAVRPVGVTDSKEGRMSPANLYTSTITDELRMNTSFKGKVIGISLKDRGSILPAGHAANAAYWYDGRTGQWISSSYYMKDLPQWVKSFNDKQWPQKYLSSSWNTLLPVDQYMESTADDVPYEEAFKGESKPVFPHDLPALKGKDYSLLSSTPFGNTFTKDFAIKAIESEELGKDDITDFLAISFSSTDYVGHRFGPNSVETEDTYLRLDRDIADLLRYVDSAFGRENVMVFLTADHGAALNSSYASAELKLPTGLFSEKKLLDSLNNFLSASYGKGMWAQEFLNQQVYLDHKLIQARKLNEKELIQKSIDFLSELKGVQAVMSAAGMQEREFAQNTLEERVKNGYNTQRSGDIFVIFQPGWMDYKSTGTTHGSPYSYDTHIPLLWYGWKINQGSSNSPVNMTDIAPTIAAVLHLQAPNGNQGNPIKDVIY